MRDLVTVAVATYHSAEFILETLESIYNQTYNEIALVVSDDGSTDETVAIVNQWVNQEKVKNRFDSIEVITVPKNTGVSGNCNRCINAAPSDWVKFIAGDDILLPNCIEDNMSFLELNPNANIIFSQVKTYQDTFESKNYVSTIPSEFPNNIMHPSFSAEDQYKILLVSDRIKNTPSSFVNKHAQFRVGGFDDKNLLVEDYPMWLKLTNSGEKLYYFHKETVGYRIHSKASNNVGEEVLFKPSVLNSFKVRKEVSHPFLPWEMVKSEQFVYAISLFFQKNGLNKNNQLNRFLYKTTSFYLNPFYYIYAIKKRLPSNKDNFFYK